MHFLLLVRYFIVLKGLFNYAPFVYCFKLIILLLYIHAHYTCNIVRELCFIYPCFLYCYIPYHTGCNSNIEMYCIDIHCSI